MHGWWIFMGAVIAVAAAVTPKIVRPLRRRAQVDRVKAALSTWLPALEQPGGSPRSGVADPPTPDSVSPSGSAARRRIRVALGDPSLSATLSPRRAA